MKINQIEYINEKFDVDLKNRLSGRIFHLTALASFVQIQIDGSVFHNQFGERKLNTSSGASFGRKNGWVCLFDLRNRTNKAIKNTIFKYNFLRPNWFINYGPEFTESNITYLFLNPKYYGKLIPNEHGEKGEFYIPKVECWYPGNLPLDYIEEALSVKILRDATQSDLYVHMMQSMKPRRAT